MNRIASNEKKQGGALRFETVTSVVRFEIQANKMLEGVLLYRRSVFKPLHCSDRFFSKTDVSVVAFVSQNVQSFNKIHRIKHEKIHC